MSATIQHFGITSPFFELVKTVEFDIQIGDVSFSLKLELFCDVSDTQRFRAHIWRLENYRIQPTFPQDKITSQPSHESSDETIFVDTALWLSKKYDNFQAETSDKAIQIVLDDLRFFLIRTLGDEK